MARTEKIWLKRVDIPIWIVQLICLLIFTASAAIALYAVERYGDDLDFDASVERALNAGVAVQLAFSVFTIILVIVEIILAAIHRLRPVANIVIQCIKTAIWSFFFILSIIAAAGGTVSGWSIFLVLVLWLTCVALLVYGSVILHRHRKGTLYRGNYSGVNAQNTTYSSQFEPAPAGSYAASHQSNPFHDPHNQTYGAQGTTYPHSAETAYRPQGAAGDYYGGGTQNTYEMHGNAVRY